MSVASLPTGRPVPSVAQGCHEGRGWEAFAGTALPGALTEALATTPASHRCVVSISERGIVLYRFEVVLWLKLDKNTVRKIA